ncbi:MAG: M20/M25/M40 family metallo-hydrolase [Clostridia bacterium]|nr:M20/M25/M40 family metallo-hydrolase [Clostridia bacterium]
MIVLYSILGALAVLVAIIALNTWIKKPSKRKEGVAKFESDLERDKIAKHLSGMIQLKTLTASSMDGFDKEAFLGLHKYLEKTYPLVHKTLGREVVNEYSLIYKWTGSGSQKKPFLMMAHMDVVPVDERTAGDWEHDAFSGAIADGYVWGRGALDMKGHLTAVMEAVEKLISDGFAPQRDVYIALGHDEESMGTLGAQKCVEVLKKRGESFEFVIDEGGVLMDGTMLSVNADVAAIGICEKGYADIRLSVASKGGHASRPPKQTAVGTLCRAIVAIEKHQMKPTLNEAMKHMLDCVGGYMKFPLNVIVSNMWLFRPLLLIGLAAGSNGAAMVRTTMAPTMLAGSTATNVLAEKAEAVINCRISPDDTVQGVLDHIRKVIGNDDVIVEEIKAFAASRVSDTDSEGFATIARTVEQMFGEFVVAPYLMVAATDSKFYSDISDGVFLFQPFRSVMQDLSTIHAVNERMGVESLSEGVEFFAQLVRNADER